ncbi:MAG TPA: alpha-L-rhamnosidase, partial [Bacteroidetes bacterium]|nr:alpha-L-rhamnosidase [Bacteroidota bacterium]
SLYWVNMLHDYWMYRDDPAFVREMLPGTRTVLTWFSRRQDEGTGLLGKLEWWNFVDWAPEYREGVPPGTDEGGSAILTLHFVWALQDAADLERALGDADLAEKYEKLARKAAQAVYELCWDKQRGLLANSPRHELFSQHANILGVLTDAIPADQQRAVVEKLLADSSLVQATYYYRFYLHWAVRKVGLGDLYLDLLDPWRKMLRLGLTTWAETPEPTRSDCHAWSAHPNIDLLATVCGIRPAEPGFRKVLVEPFLGKLQRVTASVPHPRGMIQVSLQRAGETGLRATVTLPDGLDGVFRWRGEERELNPGRNDLRF